MSSNYGLREVPLEEAPALDGWLDLTEGSLGVDVLSRVNGVAFVIHMKDDRLEPIGLSFDPDGARLLAKSLMDAADSADNN